MNVVDKRLVGASFSRAAPRYDARATVQARVRERILALLAEAAPRAGRVLDVGVGTGALLARLAGSRPHLDSWAVDLAPAMCVAARSALPRALVAAADAEALPYRSGAFDLVVSTSMLQWLSRLDTAFAEARRVLAPGGLFCIALFGERTLFELRESWAAAAPGAGARAHRFASRSEVAAALAARGFQQHEIAEEEIVERHPDARSVLRALKEVGAASAVPGRSGLGGRAAIVEALRRYDGEHGTAGGVPATYHVVYALSSTR